MHEETLIFGPEQHLVGTLTLPDGAADTGADKLPMALLTNAGVVPRVGPHRINVRLARRFAEMGIATLRFDMSGLGDSRRSGSTLPAGRQFVADTRSAMDFLGERFGCERFLMVGICSGADTAYHAALEDPRLQAAVLFDPYVYPTPRAKLLGLVHRMRRHGVLPTLGGLGRHLRRVHSTAPESGNGGLAIYGRAKVPPVEEFGAGIRFLVDRGVELFFLYSGGAPDWYNHADQFPATFRRYGFLNRVNYQYLSCSDHTLTQLHAQEAFIASVSQWMRERVVVSAKAARTEVTSGVPSLSSAREAWVTNS